MSPTATFRPLVIALSLAAASARAQAQCFDWAEGFGAPGISGPVEATLVFDDGSGPELYVGGSFQSAGDVRANGIAKWNGSRWAALGSSVDAPPLAPLSATNGDRGSVNALAVFDDGSGPALYAAGLFTSIGGVAANNIAKWDGANWSPVGNGANRWLECLLAFDDGSGPALYAGGAMSSAGGVPCSGIARWNGSSWSAVGTTFPSSPLVRALAIYDDGSGPALHGGGYWNFGGVVHNAAKWNGASWSPLGGGVQTVAYALAVFDDGSGPALFLGGSPNVGSSTVLAKWNGTNWSAIAGFSGGVQQVAALQTFDDGTGTALYVGGHITTAAGAAIARWNGASFSFVGASTGLEGVVPFVMDVHAFGVYDDGTGAALYTFGTFEHADGAAALNAARYDASGWSGVNAGLSPTATVSALHEFDDGSGPALFVAGNFNYAGTLASERFAKWNGSSWTAIGASIPTGGIATMTDFDDGSGSALYVAGNFTSIGGTSASRIARWTGAGWAPLGLGLGGPGAPHVDALAVFDDGSGDALYAAGDFTLAGGSSAKRIAKWNGTTWSSVGPGFPKPARALAVFDDGSGPKLYAAGEFGMVGGVSMPHLAAWDGTSWSDVGGGVDNDAHALQVHDDGSGPALYVGGIFASAGSTNAQLIARWNGTSWSQVGFGLPGQVFELAEFDRGDGLALYAVSDPTDSAHGDRLHRWDGAAWTEIGEFGASVEDLEGFDDGSGPALYAAGSFPSVDGIASVNLAKWSHACTCPPLAYCTAGTSSNGCVPSIGASGTASASGTGSFVVTASNVEGQKQGLLFYGVSGATAAPWGASTSTLCVKPPQQRTGQLNSGGTSGGCNGAFVLDFNAYVASHSTALGQPFSAGDTVRMQGWYRDPPNPKTTSLTDALEFYLCP